MKYSTVFLSTFVSLLIIFIFLAHKYLEYPYDWESTLRLFVYISSFVIIALALEIYIIKKGEKIDFKKLKMEMIILSCSVIILIFSLGIFKYKHDNSYVFVEITLQKGITTEYLVKYQVTDNGVVGNPSLYVGSVRKIYIDDLDNDSNIIEYRIDAGNHLN